MQRSTAQITRMLREWGDGDREVMDRLVPLVYEQLHDIARARLRRSAGLRSLDTTGLVHEAYLRLADLAPPTLRDRSHFFALSARIMRCVMVDHARARRAAKRGGGVAAVTLTEELWIAERDSETLLALHEALGRLEALHAEQARALELRYFGGLSLEETAAATGVSLATIKRELRAARAWLAMTLADDAG